MARRGFVDLCTLELNEGLLAFCLGFKYRRKLYYYLPAFDPDFARYAPSTALLAHLIERAYALGLDELDLMLGDEPYKQQWANGQRATVRLVVAAPGVRGVTALALARAYLLVRGKARTSPLVQRVRRHGLGALFWR